MCQSPLGNSRVCPDCAPSTRRDFLKSTAAGIAAGAGVYALGGMPRLARANEAAAAPAAESLVATFYKSLTPEQSKIICFDFDHPLRHKVDNNWFIVKKSIRDLLSPDQRQMVRDIFTDLHS